MVCVMHAETTQNHYDCDCSLACAVVEFEVVVALVRAVVEETVGVVLVGVVVVVEEELGLEMSSLMGSS